MKIGIIGCGSFGINAPFIKSIAHHCAEVTVSTEQVPDASFIESPSICIKSLIQAEPPIFFEHSKSKYHK
jgi:hypothetical protein